MPEPSCLSELVHREQLLNWHCQLAATSCFISRIYLFPAFLSGTTRIDMHVQKIICLHFKTFYFALFLK